jgi:hypothetical protein
MLAIGGSAWLPTRKPPGRLSLRVAILGPMVLPEVFAGRFAPRIELILKKGMSVLRLSSLT